ncbi:MAG: ornithine carbamoyltransferase [Dehalococcoidales bacterium]
MKGKHLLSIADFADEGILPFVREAVEMKSRGRSGLLDGKLLALLFEKPSLRTRVSFEAAMNGLGGRAIYLSPAEVGLGQRESVPDVARVLSGYVDAIAARTFAQSTIEELAEYCSVPVINSLTDREHPCQALADFVTIYEKKGGLSGVSLAFIGDGNNVANSLVLAAALSGMDFRIASPTGYAIEADVLSQAREYALASGGEITCVTAPAEAVAGADVVYTDVWTSMGQEAESEKRLRAFDGYQVNDEMMALAASDAIFMHDLPAHRGEEVANSVIDSGRSVVFEQAENRMHALKPLLARLLTGR